MKKNDKNTEPAYKTEDQLKAEAKAQLELERKIAAMRKPPTRIEQTEKKIDNFFYHYKSITIILVVVVVLIAFFIRDTITRPNPDITITLLSEGYFKNDSISALEQAFIPYMTDLNGDGKVSVVVDYMMISRTEPEQGSADAQAAGTMGGEIQYANNMKLMAVLSTAADPIFLMDNANYEFMYNSGASEDSVSYEPGSIFYLLDSEASERGEGLPFSSTKLAEDIASDDFDKLSFYCRAPTENAKEKNVLYFERCREIAQSLVK